MEFRRIHHFVHVAELGSLSMAAERLHIVQPALSQSIRRLEEELGVTLFRRSRRGMELTAAGQMFLKSAYGIINQFNRAKESISAIGRDPVGQVSVAMTASAMNVLTVPLCATVQSRFDGISLNIEEGLAANIQQGLEAGWYDLVISYMAKVDDRYHIEDLIEEELFLASPYDEATSGRELAFHELQEFRLILPQGQHGIAGPINSRATDLGITLNISPISAALHPTLQLVEAAQGHSLLPWSAMRDQIAQMRIMARKIVPPQLHHRISMTYPSHRPLTQATIAVMEIVRDSVCAMHADGKWPGHLLVRPQEQVNQD